MAPMGALRTSAFAPTSFRVKSETETAAAANTIMMALKDGQMPIVIGASFVSLFMWCSVHSGNNIRLLFVDDNTQPCICVS